MEQSLAPVMRTLTERLNLSRYRRIMADPTWDFVVRALIATRSYAKGAVQAPASATTTSPPRSAKAALQRVRKLTHTGRG